MAGRDSRGGPGRGFCRKVSRQRVPFQQLELGGLVQISVSHIICYRGRFLKKISSQICDYGPEMDLKLYFVKLQVILVVILLVMMVM